MNIRKAKIEDLSRIAEIFIYNNRMNYFPIFKDEEFSFNELQVSTMIDHYFRKEAVLCQLYVYDDGIIRGFMQLNATEICKLYVDTFFQNKGYGAQLIAYAIEVYHVSYVWALEKNIRAIAFYQRYGFQLSDERKFEEGTTEYLVRLDR